MIDQARLQELRAEHRPISCYEKTCDGSCNPDEECCLECDGDSWPCEQSAILDLALEAERLRADLRSAQRQARHYMVQTLPEPSPDHRGVFNDCEACGRILAGTEAKE